MADEVKASDRVLAVIVLLATLGMVAFNALAAAGLVNGVTPAIVSERNPSLLTPASYAFSIWSLIYAGLFAFSIYQLLPVNAGRLTRVRVLYLASCVLNVAWIWCWHHGLVGICALLLVGLAAVLVLLLAKSERADLFSSLFTSVPFALYSGWVTCAALVNINILLTGNSESASALIVLAISLIIFATAIALAVTWKLGDHIFPLAVAWALTAIAVKQSGNTAVVIAAAFGTVTCLVAAGSIVTRLKDSTSEQQ